MKRILLIFLILIIAVSIMFAIALYIPNSLPAHSDFSAIYNTDLALVNHIPIYDLEAVEAVLVADHGVAQLGHARPGRVLVALAVGDGVDGGVAHLGGTVLVREALAQVDRAGGDRQRRHLGEDRRAEALQLAGEVRLAHHPKSITPGSPAGTPRPHPTTAG